MNNTKKKILAIVLVLVVLLLGGASIYVATQLSSKQAVAPNAPASKPAATETCQVGLNCTSSQISGSFQCNNNVSAAVWCCPLGQSIINGVCSGTEWVGSDACTTTGLVSHIDCVPGAVITCDTECPTACGLPASDITVGCVDTCGDPATKHCLATAPCDDCTVKYYCNTDTYACETTELKYKNTPPYLTCDPNAVAQTTCATDIAGESSKTAGVCYSALTLCQAACVQPEVAVLNGLKKAYKNVTTNTAGNYSLTTEMTTVSKSQIYVYTIELKNISKTKAMGVVIKDSLAEQTRLTYMDTVSGCSYSTTSKELTCNTTIDPQVTKKFSFRVKAADDLVNGEIITNTARVTYTGGTPLTLTKSLTASTVVGCNLTCTTSAECSTGLVCDTTTSKCRLNACLTQSDCACPPEVTETIAPTATATLSPTATATLTVAPTTTTTTTVTVAPTTTTTTTVTQAAGTGTAIPTKVASVAEPTILPETGIFDLPGIAAFGGGLILAIVGILLAL